MTVSVRHAALSDMAGLRKVFRQASLSNPGDQAALLAHPEVLEFSDRAVREGHTRVAALEDGSILGFATTARTHHTVELEDLFVDPSWRFRGVARALLSDVVANARRAGVNRIEVIANRHALAFYEAVGFRVDGMAETRFGDGLRMHLDITPSRRF